MGRTSKKDKWREALSIAHTKLSPEIINKFKDAFAIGANIKQACFYAEISEATYYDWVNKYPILSEEFAKMRQRTPLQAKRNIAEAIQNKNLGLSQWIVERQEPDEYCETLKIKDEGNEEDKKAIKEFHEKLKRNIRNRIKNANKT